MNYTNFQVGEKFPLPIKAQGDGGIFQYDANGAMFILKLSAVDVIAIEAFRTGKFSLGLFTQKDILFFLYKIDGIVNGWGDCPYALQFHERQQRPDFSKVQEPMLNCYLVDSRLDILLAMRAIRLSDDFYQKLLEIIKAQADIPFSRDNYASAIQQIWSQYTSDDMAAQAYAHEETQLDIPIPGKALH